MSEDRTRKAEGLNRPEENRDGKVQLKDQYEVVWDHIVHQNEYRSGLLTFYTTLAFASLAAVAWLRGTQPGPQGNKPALPLNIDPRLVGFALIVAAIMGAIVIVFVAKAGEVRDRFLVASTLLAGGPQGGDFVGYVLTADKKYEAKRESPAVAVEGQIMGGYQWTTMILSLETAAVTGAAAQVLGASTCLSIGIAILVLALMLVLSFGYRRRLINTWPPALRDVKIKWP